MKKTYFKTISVLILMIFPFAAYGQQCEVLEKISEGFYIVVIQSDTLLTITQEDAKKKMILDNKVHSLEAEIMLKDSLIHNYETFEAKLLQDRERLKDYITDLESIYTGYKELSEGYRKLSKDNEGWLSFSAGLGATGKDTKPVLLGGIGIKQFRVWGILQENNAGVAVGVHLPIF